MTNTATCSELRLEIVLVKVPPGGAGCVSGVIASALLKLLKIVADLNEEFELMRHPVAILVG